MTTPRLRGDTSIPFIRTFPSGETRLQTIDRGPDRHRDACKFIAHGGRYLILVVPGGTVEMVAVICRTGESDDARAVAFEECENGPELLDRVDLLVRRSVAALDAVQ